MKLLKFFFLFILFNLLVMRVIGQNVYLLISNESQDIQNIDLEVKVDGKIITNKTFYFTPNANDYETFYLKLKKGFHRLEVISKNENLHSSEKFLVAKNNYIFVSFNYKIMQDTVVQRLKFYMENTPDTKFVADSVWEQKGIKIKHFNRKITIH